MDDAAATRALLSDESILDFSLRELTRLRTLAPASASAMIVSNLVAPGSGSGGLAALARILHASSG